MPKRDSVEQAEEIEVDFGPFHEGLVLLKFGRKGPAHEKVFTLTEDNRYIVWKAALMSPKFGAECEVDLEQVIRLQKGQTTAPFLRQERYFGPAKCNSLSLIYLSENRERSLDIIAPNEHVYEFLVTGIQNQLEKIKKEKAEMSLERRFLKKKWEDADSDRSGYLNRREVLNLVNSLNIKRPKEEILELYARVDSDGSHKLNFAQFHILMDLIRRRHELEHIWVALVRRRNLGSTPNPFDLTDDSNTPAELEAKITVDQFLAFWRDVQGEDVTYEDAVKLIQHSNSNREDGGESEASGTEIGYKEWRSIMLSQKNDVYSPDMTVEYQDMTRPLSEYYIASSHNTYLEGDQLTSASSVNRYIDDLMNGCRCVELDCWNGDKGEPIIYHGHTLTGKILFRDVIQAIARNAFINSPYPVILSLETHCDMRQQRVMADIMKTVLGDMLCWPEDLEDSLPSPEALKNKVLLKGKRLPTEKTAHIEHDDVKYSDEDDPDHEEIDEELRGQHEIAKSARAEMPKKEKGCHPELSQITYLGTGKVKQFTSRVSNDIPPDLMSSFSENTMMKYAANPTTLQGWVYHNTGHLSRIYPKGSRVDSSNYDPCPAWAAGAQMVALNWQTTSTPPLLCCRGKFKQNGNVGYVLKPSYMLRIPSGRATPLPLQPIRLTVHLISGSQLPKPGGEDERTCTDPYVNIRVHGMPIDTKDFKSKIINRNGFNPVWDQIFTFDIQSPDVAHLMLFVMDQELGEDRFVAYSSIPLPCVRPGFRNVQLYDEQGRTNGEYAYASLFVRIVIEPLLVKRTV